MAFSASVVMLIASSITAAPRIIITKLVMEDWSDDYRNDTVLFCFEVKAAEIVVKIVVKIYQSIFIWGPIFPS